MNFLHLFSEIHVFKGANWEHMGLCIGCGHGYSATDIDIIANYVYGSKAAGIFIEKTSSYRGPFILQYTIAHLFNAVVYNTVRDTLADGIHNTWGSNNGYVGLNHVINVGDDGIAVVSYIPGNFIFCALTGLTTLLDG